MPSSSRYQPYLQDGSQHAGSDAFSLPSNQAAADWLKSTLEETDTFLTLSLLTHQHTLTWNGMNKMQWDQRRDLFLNSLFQLICARLLPKKDDHVLFSLSRWLEDNAQAIIHPIIILFVFNFYLLCLPLFSQLVQPSVCMWADPTSVHWRWGFEWWLCELGD